MTLRYKNLLIRAMLHTKNFICHLAFEEDQIVTPTCFYTQEIRDRKIIDTVTIGIDLCIFIMTCI